MAPFDYRTFLLPQLHLRAGALGGLMHHHEQLFGNDFMKGEIEAANANQLLSAAHDVAVLLNLAGYMLEGVALAAKTDSGSAALYVNLFDSEYETYTATNSDPQHALKYVIDKDFPAGSDVCLALRIAPRPRWWSQSASIQYYAMAVPQTALNNTNPVWLLLGAVHGTLPDVVPLHVVLAPLESTMTGFRNTIADALATEWKKASAQRKGLLNYLNPDEWGDTVVGTEDKMRLHYVTIYNVCKSVYQWLESLSKDAFKNWLLQPTTGCFKETLRIAQGTNPERKSVADLQEAIKSVFCSSHSYRDWVKFDHVWELIDELDVSNTYTLYVNVLMMLEELTVIDMLGKVRQTIPSHHETLPFSITGFYEQIPPLEFEDKPTLQELPSTIGTYDFHTLQINQAGIYAHGFWQHRIPWSCDDPVNGGRYLAFRHYRFCFTVLGDQSYDDPDQTECYMQVYRWRITNLTTSPPYLKLPSDATVEAYCNTDVSDSAVLVGTVRIVKTAQLETDTLIPDPEKYFHAPPAHGVELEIDISGETIRLRRISPAPFVPQADLIEVAGKGREDLVITQRFPLHSSDKLRVIAAIQKFIDLIEVNSAIFASDNILPEDSYVEAVKSIDEELAVWMGRYICHYPNMGTTEIAPNFLHIRRFIVDKLAKTKMYDDQNVEVLTVLAVFLSRVEHAGLMPHTRAMLGDGLPQVTPDMEAAVENGSMGLHTYRWGTNGLGEKAQTTIRNQIFQDWLKAGLKKGVELARLIVELLDDLDTFLKPFSLDANIFVLEMEKIGPLEDAYGNPYPGWEAGKVQRYLGIQWGGGLGLTSGVFLEANSSQTMWAIENWSPGDFSGPTITFIGSLGLVFDLNVAPMLRIDVNSWYEGLLKWLPGTQLLANWVGFDIENLKLGLSLSMTVFIGHRVFVQPIRSGPSFEWVDYNYGIAGILEANVMDGILIHIPETIQGLFWDDEVVPSPAPWATTPESALQWRVVESSKGFDNFNAIDVWALEDEAKARIREVVAEYLACFRNRNTKLSIIGHASPVGTEAYNYWLSQKRAQAVYDYIRSLIPDDEYGILAQNTTIQGYGELYATHYAMYDPNALAPEWQVVNVFINGQLTLRLSEKIG